jgi:ketosteroid isomerase-like protein
VSCYPSISIWPTRFHCPKGDREDKGRFVTVWKKVNGEWKVAHDIGSTTMPETATEKKQ